MLSAKTTIPSEEKCSADKSGKHKIVIPVSAIGITADVNKTVKSLINNVCRRMAYMDNKKNKADVKETVNSLINEVCQNESKRKSSNIQQNQQLSVSEDTVDFQVIPNNIQVSKSKIVVSGHPKGKNKEPPLRLARGNSLPNSHYIGQMNEECQHCGAYKFPSEHLFKCCHNGKVDLSPPHEYALHEYPVELKNLLLGNTCRSNNLRKNIRQFNNAFAFASFGAHLAPPPGNGPPCFRICGQIFHRTGTLHPAEGMPPLYGQLYIYDGESALEKRKQHASNHDCDGDVMQIIQDVILRDNRFARAYKNMAEIEHEENIRAEQENRPRSEVTMRMLRGGDPRRYNLPNNQEVAAIFVANNGAPPDESQRDIVIYPRDRPLEKISILSRNLDPMIYPLFFPKGDYGYNINIPHNSNFATRVRNKITMSQFYNYRLACRPVFSPLHFGKQLFNQYCCDAYLKIEGARLDWYRRNQDKLRVETYQGLIDHLNTVADNSGRQVGTLMVLPSSFNGSPRAMQQHYNDAMAIIKKFGKPDLFLTFTCNPKWDEIQQNLSHKQYASDRPDLVSRVFHIKLKELINDIVKIGVLGKTVAFIHVIEFQKRGLPHVHLLMHLSEEDKLTEAEDIDSLICAELPDPITQKQLFHIVSTCMTHGPCGLDNPDCSCMEDGKCSKKFPKEFSDVTDINTDGYPTYRRRNDGRTVTVKCKGRSVILDNRSIVPYCPWLTMKYNAHINLEACMSMKCVKYLYKYVYKGHDCANIEIQEILHHDEIKTYIDARYLSAPEAVWRIFEFHMHEESHSVKRLPVHLPHCQYVYFHGGRENHIDYSAEHSKLLSWFHLNAQYEEANKYLYTEITDHYVYKDKDKKWVARKRGKEKIITRMVSARPNEGERFYLRMLLLHVPGAKSFEDLRTVDGVLANTFREACLLNGFLQDDTEWEITLREAIAFQMPWQLRQLFAIILIYCDPSNPLMLWERFKVSLVEDFIHRGMDVSIAEQAALADINRVLVQAGKSLISFNLPELEELPPQEIETPICITELLEVRRQLNVKQLEVADNVISSVENNNSEIFYLDASAGTGKTFTFNYIISELRSRGFKVATAAWTGIAATLLKNGSTLHKLFRLPVPILDTSTCRVSPVSKKADELREIHLFILDEASMIPIHALHAIDRLLRDICNNNIPLGGKIFLLGGDFRQVLPVLRNGRPAEIMEICLKNSYLWPTVKTFYLTENMRARTDEYTFCKWLLEIGDGTTKQSEPFPGCVEVPPCFINNNLTIINAMYDNVSIDDFASRVILTPRNDESLNINNLVLCILPGNMITYYSADEIQTDDEDERNAFPIEFINQQTPSGMPPHCLKLKVGAVVMLLRNLDLNKGLCNGTRLIVTKLLQNIVQCRVICGVATGNIVLIPRVQLAPSDTGLPFTLSRRQFPLRLAYSMTINKSQGQTFEKVGVYLKKPCFSHGQLYVAFSRARSFADIVVKVFPSNKQGQQNGKVYTTNVVYKQVLN